VSVDVEPDPVVDVDPRHLERMLIDLLDNAARHAATPS